MLGRLREQVRKSGYQEPLVVIERDEVLRVINHEIMSRVFLGWAIIQGLAGSLIGMLLDEQLLLGFTLMAFSVIAILVWQIWITKRGLVLAAKEGTLSSPESRRVAIKIAVFQGVFFAFWMGLVRALWWHPEENHLSQVIYAVLQGIGFGGIMWFMNGRLSRRKHA